MLVTPSSIILIIESRWTYPTCASQCTHGEENWHLGEICVFFMECDGGGYAGGLGGTTILFFCEKKRRSPFPRVVEGFRFLNLVMILIRYLNTCKKRLGQNLMVCKKAPAIFSSRLQFAKTLFCMVGGWLVCFKAIVFFAEHRSFVIFAHFYQVYNHHLPFLHPKLDIVLESVLEKNVHKQRLETLCQSTLVVSIYYCMERSL